MPSASFQNHLKTLKHEIDDWLESYLTRLNVEGAVPSRLIEAIRYSLLAPGKRIRPILVLLACEACGSDRKLTLPAAAAVEMVHTYSLVHDDLPAMDDDDLRRGRPTNHKAFDEATAILVGDALLTLAFQVLAQEIHPPTLAVTGISLLSQAAGLYGMVGGQMDDILCQGQSAGTLEQLQSIHIRKTGALLKVSVALGSLIALQGNQSDTKFIALQQYAHQLGLAFQIADDLLDVQSSPSALGKNTQKDAPQGKLTYPRLLGIEGAKHELQLAHERGRQALEALGPSGKNLGELLTYVVERDH